MENQWLLEATIDDLQDKMAKGELTSLQLTLLYLERIAEYDKDGVKLNSVIEINPDALHTAEALDLERAQKGPRGPLHGLPILIKDNINTADKMHTSAGSLALAHSYANQDAFLVEQLRAAGAVLLGKTNLTEFANFMTENMPNGYSSRGGQTLNPYGPGTFDVGGSSAGSGASIAANLAVAAIGTETSGSILSPASNNSLVGIKPTVGLISRSGILPIAHSQDTAGPMARTVRDAATLLGALAGVDPKDTATRLSEGRFHTDYTQFLDLNGLQGARIGVPREVYYEEMKEDQLELLNAAIQVLQDAGASVIDPVVIPTAKEDWSWKVLVYEFKSDLNAYLNELGPQAPYRSLQEIIGFNLANAGTALKYGQTVLLESEATSGTLTEPEYAKTRARDLMLSRTKGIDAVLQEHRLDALLFPSYFGCDIAAKAGYPSVTVPAGYGKDGFPIGATFTGSAFSEPTLIRLAYAFEQKTKHRVPPTLD